MDIGYYKNVKELETKEWAAVTPYLFTYGLCVGIDPQGDCHRTRYCYPDGVSAEKALEEWDGRGDPPGPWIKQKPQERTNPQKGHNR